MFAVVQIGSNTRRSPLITARNVLDTVGPAWARARCRAPAATATPAARPVFSTLRRVVVILVPLWQRIQAAGGVRPARCSLLAGRRYDKTSPGRRQDNCIWNCCRTTR